MANERNDPSDAGAPRPIPATPEVIALALQGINEEEILAGIREIQNGGGHRLEDFIGELEEIGQRVKESIASQG